MYALKEGAKKVVSLDTSAKAIDLVNANLALNEFSTKKHESIVGETLPYLKNCEEEFDIYIYGHILHLLVCI